MHANRLGVLIVSIVGALVAGGAPPASAGPPNEACALLTQAQVSGALGTSVGAGEAITPTACQWMATHPTGDATARLTVELQSADGFAAAKTPLPGITKTEASGIGDDALYTTVASLTTLAVKKGTRVFVVRLYGVPGTDKQKAVEKTLALDVLPNL